MKTKRELTIAYELISYEIERLLNTGELTSTLKAVALNQRRDILCWMLDHEHETEFAEMIADLKKSTGAIELDEGWEEQGELKKCQVQ